MLTNTDPKLPANIALFPGPQARSEIERQLGVMLADAQAGIAGGSVTPTLDLDRFREELAAFTFGSEIPLPEVLEWCTTRLQTGLVQLNHPRYLGLFNPAPSFASQCADRIAASFNPQLASTASSPVAVAIEAHVIQAVAGRAGLPAHSTGHFTSGGSEANATSMVCALTQAAPDFRAIGSRAFAGQPVCYISRDSHLAWVKAAHQSGIGRDGARMVPTDGAGRMCIASLNAAIEADRAAGAIPFMVVATAGTTNAGMVDPLEQIAGIAARENLWFHVDGAWGGGVIASDHYLPRLAGIEKADSATIDAHKWFATTMGAGMFLCARPQIVSDTFNVSANFMPSQSAAADPYLNSMQWSRRFIGLRLFLSLACAGWAGHAAHVERSFTLIDQLTLALRRHGWSTANGDDALAVACLLPPPGSPPPREIAARVIGAGSAWVSAAVFEGTDVIRACVTHGETTPEDIEKVVEALENARNR